MSSGASATVCTCPRTSSDTPRSLAGATPAAVNALPNACHPPRESSAQPGVRHCMARRSAPWQSPVRTLQANARMSRQLRAKTCGLYFFFPLRTVAWAIARSSPDTGISRQRARGGQESAPVSRASFLNELTEPTCLFRFPRLRFRPSRFA